MLNNIKTKLKNRKKGFSLIEMVVVIAIMAILALIMVPNLTAYIQKGDDAQIKANMKNVHTAAELAIQANPRLSPKDIATDAAINGRIGATGAANLKAEIAKFANLDLAKNPITFTAPVSTVEGTYYLQPDGTTGKIMLSYNSDRVLYTFNGTAYTEIKK